MGNHLYTVQYGINNSHMCEFESFKLYRDAKKFYESLDVNRFKAAICYKVLFNKDTKISESKEPKLFRFEPGIDNTKMLNEMVIFV